LPEAYEQAAMGMFGYMTEIDTVEPSMVETVTAEGDDLISLLYHFLDEWLFVFSADPFFIPRFIKITEFDEENFKITSEG
jgi:SHS2 domain-containing protein